MSSRLFDARALVIAVGGLSFLAGLLVFWAMGKPGVSEPPASPPGEPPSVQPAKVQPVAVPVQPSSSKTESKKLRLPDGSEVEPLNGVTSPALMTWGVGPYSPIIGTEHGNGVDWYVHRDGSRTTTLEVWRPELGRLDPVTLVYRAGVVPVAVDPGK